MRKIYFIALLAISACAPVYVPNVRNSPMFTKGGEFQASVQIGNGWEGQSAYALTDHFGLMANFSYANNTGFDPDTEDSDYHRHMLFEGGAGYFSNGPESFFEVFAGYGAGEGSSVDEYTFFGSQSVVATGKYKRYFLQPAFGINGKEIDVSFVSRFSMVDFYNFSNESYSMTVNEEPKFFFEPAFVGRANLANNRMFVIFQGGVSLGLSENIYFSRRSFQFSTGIGLRLGGKRELVSRTD
jgi:hypothetical protein